MNESYSVEKSCCGGYDLIKTSVDYYDCNNIEYNCINTFKSKAKAEKVAKLLNED